MRRNRLALALAGAVTTTSSAAIAASPSGANIATLFDLAPAAAAPASLPVQFDVVLPLTNTAALATLLTAQQNPTSPQFHQWLTPSQFASQFGPSPISIFAAEASLRSYGLTVTQQSRSLHVTGTEQQVAQFLGTGLAFATTPSGQQRLVTQAPMSLPIAMVGLGAVVPAFSPRGFDATTSARRISSGYARRISSGYGQPASGAAPTGGLFYGDLKQAYSYPSYQTMSGVGAAARRVDGTGATVAVVMSSDILDSDVQALFDSQGFTSNSGLATDPAVFARRPVNGGASFSASNPAAEEASLDVEQVLGGAPGSHVLLYDTPDLSDQSLVSAYIALVNDNAADVVSMSYGQCEQYYTAVYNGGQSQTAILAMFSELFEQGSAQGMTFIAASGDSGGLDCITPSYFAGGQGQFIPGVSVPAADPNVTAVGGTNLVTNPPASGSATYFSENAWSDPEIPYDPYGLGTNVSGGVWGAGGGVSTIYPAPAWQQSIAGTSRTFRSVPDIGMQAGGCPDVAVLPCNGGDTAIDGQGDSDRSVLNIVFNGLWDGVIGTSASAPELASAIALLVGVDGRQGNINPLLYLMAQREAAGGAAYFNQSVPGFNGNVANSGAYNFTTGNGTPNVSMLLGLQNGSLAGTPNSPTNP